MRQQEGGAVAVASRRRPRPNLAAPLARSPGLVGPAGAPRPWPLRVCSCLVVISGSQWSAAPSHLLGGSAGHTAALSAAAALAPELESTLSACGKLKTPQQSGPVFPGPGSL